MQLTKTRSDNLFNHILNFIDSNFGPFESILTFPNGTTELRQCINVPLAQADNIVRPPNIINVFNATITFQGEMRTMLLGQIFLMDITGMCAW